jgi:hypothetical protein
VAKIEKLGQKGKRFKKKKRVVETTRVHMRKLLIPQLASGRRLQHQMRNTPGIWSMNFIPFMPFTSMFSTDAGAICK